MTAGDIKVITGDHHAASMMSGIVVNGADDYVQINAVATHEAGANNTMGSISAWINVPDATGTYCIFSVGVNAAISHIQMQIKAGKLNAVATAGGVAQFDVVATTASITPHKWHHVVVTHNGTRPILYMDGARIAMTDSVSTDLTYWMNDLATWDKASIGILNMNATTTLDYKGAICYVKYSSGTTSAAVWTPAEVLAEYRYRGGLGIGSGKTPNLCTWTFNGNCTETTTGGATYDGTISSDVQYDSEYSQLTSKLRTLAPLVADDFAIYGTGGGGYIFAVVKAA